LQMINRCRCVEDPPAHGLSERRRAPHQR
jgi:hypothetical protein